MSAIEDSVVFIIDIGNAFLESKLDKSISMNMPKDLCKALDMPDIEVDIVNGLYGLKQAGRLWYQLLSTILKEFGFLESKYDPCVFTYSSDNIIIRLATHVDDILIICSSIEAKLQLISFLESRLRKVKVTSGDSFIYLGLEILRDRSRRMITVSQYRYAERIIEEAIGVDGKSSTYPLRSEELASDETGTYPSINGIIGKLRYLADRTRPDLLYCLSYISRFMEKPSCEVMIELTRLVSYIKETLDYCLHLGGTAPINLYVMSDASFVQSGECKSQLGYAVYLSDTAAAVSNQSKRSTVSLSSTQSEADALVEAIKEILWFQGLFQSIGVTIKTPTLVLVDNSPVVSLAGQGNHLKKSKHFVVKTAYIKEQVELGNIDVQHISGVLNHSDIHTKPLSGSLLHLHSRGLLGIID